MTLAPTIGVSGDKDGKTLFRKEKVKNLSLRRKIRCDVPNERKICLERENTFELNNI